MVKRFIATLICVTFSFSNLQYSYAQDFSVNQLPVPGIMVGISTPFAPLALKGLIVNPQKPLEFQFIVDTGRGSQDTASIKEEANQLVKYFLTGLTIPEGDLWVNLSPYEKNRMVPEALGQTDLGRDLLAQDYILKQLTASLIYPEKDLGKEFWSRVYAKAQEQFGTTNIPVNTFNKVWILPDQAQVFEHGAAAYVTKATLKVMLDEDYTALQKHLPVHNSTDSIGSQIIRQIVIPEITKEVNHGRNFAPLRQIYQALILAKWYKETIQNGLLDAVYTNKNKVAGVNLNDPAVKEQIYERYLKAYKKGAFNYIKEDQTPDGQVVPRKYFSGGTSFDKLKIDRKGSEAMISVKNWARGILFLLTIVCASINGQTVQENGSPVQIQVSDAISIDKLISQLSSSDPQEQESATQYISLNQNNKDLFQQVRNRLLSSDKNEKKNYTPLLKIYESLGAKWDVDDIPVIISLLHSGDGLIIDRVLNHMLMHDYFMGPKYEVLLPDLIKISKHNYVGSLRKTIFLFRVIFHMAGKEEFVLGVGRISTYEAKEIDFEGINKDIHDTASLLISVIRRAEQLLENVNARDIDGKTSLMLASRDGDVEIVDQQIRKGADVNAKARNGQTALSMAIEDNHPDIVDKLMAAGGNLNTVYGKTAVIDAAKKRNNYLIKLLISHGFDIEAKDEDGDTALIRALLSGSDETIQLLLKLGANANARSQGQGYNLSALTIARSSRNANVYKMLIAAGAQDEAMLNQPMLRKVATSVLATTLANPAANGGIDLNQINVLRHGKTVNVQFDPAQLNALEQGGFAGFSFKIESMTRISRPFQLLGINTAKKPLMLAKA